LPPENNYQRRSAGRKQSFFASQMTHFGSHQRTDIMPFHRAEASSFKRAGGTKTALRGA
jgi:hypothetical protein